MANYRIATLLASQDASTPKVLPIPITVKKPMSRIQAVFKATSAGTAPADNPAANVSNIQLVDGSDVLVNLSGKECQALDYWSCGITPYTVYSDISSVMSIATYNINFGRMLWDQGLALDPTKFTDLTLNITHNYRTMDSAASAATLEVYGYLFDKKTISPVGMLGAKESKSYSPSAASVIEYIPMARDRMVRKYLIMAYNAGYDPWSVVNHIKVNEDNEESIPLDVQTSMWLKTVNQMYPKYQEVYQLALKSAGRAVYCAPTFNIDFAAESVAVSNITACAAMPIRSPATLLSTADGNATARIAGHNPFGSFPIMLGDPTNIDDWYNPAALGALELQLTSGSGYSGRSVKVVTEELRKY